MRMTMGVVYAGASGKAGGAVAAAWRGVPYLRKHNPAPANPQSAGQELTRASLMVLVNAWKHMPARWQAAWNTFAEKLSRSGYNCFVKANLTLQRTDVWLQASPSNPRVFPIITLAAVDAGVQKVTATWLAGDATPTDKVEIAIWKDYHPITRAAVIEASAIPVFVESDTTLVSALTKVNMTTGAGDFVVAVAVYDAVLGELSIIGMVKVTVA